MERIPALKPALNKKWQVIYTRPRWEKKVDSLLQQQGIESFCPLRKVTNQWADRKKVVELPMFNSYVFVNISWKEELKVRQTLGVLNFVYYMGKPAVVRDKEIEEIKSFIEAYSDLEILSLQDLSVGDKVRIKSGIFHDQHGKVIKIQGKRVLMVFDNLECLLVTKVEASNLTLIN